MLASDSLQDFALKLGFGPLSARARARPSSWLLGFLSEKDVCVHLSRVDPVQLFGSAGSGQGLLYIDESIWHALAVETLGHLLECAALEIGCGFELTAFD